MEINQFHSGTAAGDAITNQMLELQKVLRNAGFVSNIYAEHIAPTLKKQIIDINKYVGSGDNILLVHHSMGFDLFDKIVALPDKKAVIYHNITPERFFSDLGTKKYIRLGLEQIRLYKNYVDYAIADSNYNRRQMIEMGYENVDVMPVQISLDRFDKVKEDVELISKFANKTAILFVGRVVPNKCQDDVIKSFNIYKKNFNPDAVLLLVGDLSYYPYVEELKQMCKSMEIEDSVYFLGKISEEKLKACYKMADVFLCMSEHEGFGVPLLEAMKMQVPVIAYDSSAISETMNGAGVLLSDRNYAVVAGLIDEIIVNQEFSGKLIEKQNARIERLKKTESSEILLSVINNICNKSRLRTIQMQGPFETSYSLAIVNRKLAEALDDLGKDDVSIFCTEGPGDYEPKQSDLQDKPHATRLWEKSKNVTYPDVVIRNMYPPRVADTNGALNFQSFAWEESRVPEQYVRNFNKYLDGIGTTSEFVSKALIESGINIPVCTIGNGVELPANFENLKPYKLKTKKKNRLLHISSAFPRKGVDILVKSYCDTFTSEDDVCLIIKTFPNPHNKELVGLIEQIQKEPSSPEIELINKDLPTDELYSLYKAANCYVHAARGEGFGLPVAEAMLAKIPVIVSANTGMADFCNEDTAILVDYEMANADSHLSVTGALWAEPDADSLASQMRLFVNSPEVLDLEQKIKNAYSLISTKFTWSEVAKRWCNFIDDTADMKDKPKVSMVTTWNSKCGIAEYTKLQCTAMRNLVDFTIYPNYGVLLLQDDENYVESRLWHSAFQGDLDALIDKLRNDRNKILHIQFNYGFFTLSNLAKLIRELCGEKRIIITFHKTKEADVLGRKVSLKEIVNELNCCHLLHVHQEEDRQVLLDYGINSELIEVIPLGQPEYEVRDVMQLRRKLGIKNRHIVGSYGFLLPHKGIFENIEAIRYLKEQYPDILYLVCCSLHDSQESKDYYQKCCKAVKKWNLQENVIFITDYLPNDESMVVLQLCDALLMTYLPSNESASGAIRFCIAAKKPLVITDQPIFEEFLECAYKVPCGDVKSICQAIVSCLQEDSTEKLEAIEAKINKSSWKVVGQQWRNQYRKAEQLYENKNFHDM